LSGAAVVVGDIGDGEGEGEGVAPPPQPAANASVSVSDNTTDVRTKNLLIMSRRKVASA
jgi:hypothetical protein